MKISEDNKILSENELNQISGGGKKTPEKPKDEWQKPDADRK